MYNLQLTLEELALLSLHFPGQGWNGIILKAKKLLCDVQCELEEKRLKESAPG